MLHTLNPSRLSDIAEHCAHAARDCIFVATNAPHGAFEKAHLPSTDVQAFARALVLYAKRTACSGSSVAFRRAIGVKQGPEDSSFGHLKNLLAIEMVRAGMHPVSVNARYEFIGSIGGLVEFELTGIILDHND